MANPIKIAKFWQSFEANARRLAQMRSANSAVYDELLEVLQEIDKGLFFEFAVSPGDCELIVTAEGERSLFPIVQEIVAAAPDFCGWKFFALKPKLGFPVFIEWEGHRVTIEEVVFDPLENESDELGLRLLVPGMENGDADSAHNALLRAIDHGLGEREFAEDVAFTEVAALSAPAEEFIPLKELESYIRWRKEQRVG